MALESHLALAVRTGGWVMTEEEKKARKRERDRRWCAANPEKVRERNRRRYAANPEPFRERTRGWYAANREKGREYAWRRRGLPAPTRPAPAVCECCGGPSGKYALNLDHCHVTDKFRGWLCGKCNTAIGKLGDNVEGLQRALAYLTFSS